MSRVASPLNAQINWLIKQIRRLIARKDLAAVIIHMNDTYRIEERDPDVPGMARVAKLIERIKKVVQDGTGEDLTLVLHSGDFLGPSHMSTSLKFYGEQMCEMMNLCGVDYFTIGNHEFDFNPEVLKSRLAQLNGKMVLANLRAPVGYAPYERLVIWPKTPASGYLAITGLVGRQTIEKGRGFLFVDLDWRKTLPKILRELDAMPHIGAFFALTHMDRGEDKEAQSIVQREWVGPDLHTFSGGMITISIGKRRQASVS